MTSDLDDLLAASRDAAPSERIQFRDPIAGLGQTAIEPMSDWLGDHRLAPFAIRVLARIGEDPSNRSAVVDTLRGVDRSELPVHVIEDLDRALTGLGASGPRGDRVTGSRGTSSRPAGKPGKPGRGYWVMRTSPWERPYVWTEATAGRLRQGWGTDADQNLEVIAEALRQGTALSDSQRDARRSMRMLTSWDHGMRYGDLIVTPNLPEYGRLSVFRLTGSYHWSPGPSLRWGERFGHVLPVDLLVEDIDRHGSDVSDGLRGILRVQTRLYNINSNGGDVEQILRGLG